MALINSKKEKIELRPGDKLIFYLSSKTISFSREFERLDFCLENTNEQEYKSDKLLATFIESRTDFISFAIFLGTFFLLKGRFLKERENIFTWEFTHRGLSPERVFGPGTRVLLEDDYSSVSFDNLEQILPLKIKTDFIRGLFDYDNTLIIITRILDCSHRVIGDHDSKKRIFI